MRSRLRLKVVPTCLSCRGASDGLKIVAFEPVDYTFFLKFDGFYGYLTCELSSDLEVVQSSRTWCVMNL